MAQGYTASDYAVTDTAVEFHTDAIWLQELIDKCEKSCVKNLAIFTDKTILREGSDYDGVWLETQPMGGEMYAGRNAAVGLNNQLIFMENQRRSGRLPGMIKYGEPFLMQVSYDWLQGFCFPIPALRMYYLTGKDRGYLLRLYECLRDYDSYLWKYRDSDHDGCLESWCTWDTGEDNSQRFTNVGVKDGGFGGETPPRNCGRLPFASMDVMSYSYAARDGLARCSALLENGEETQWRRMAEQVRTKIRKYLWVDSRNACFDRDCDHQIMDVLLHNNLRCMYYGSFYQDMADRFIRYHLLNPKEFWTPVPLPSIAVNDPCFRNIDFNNWGGQPEGLTWQRAIDALENYGHVAEVRLLGKKWLHLLAETGRLVQQYDPFSGRPCRTRAEGASLEGEQDRYREVSTLEADGYGPTILAAMEYLTRLGGVDISMDSVTWSAVSDWPNSRYVQKIGEHSYRLETDHKWMKAYLDGKSLFNCSRGAAVTTDLDGKIQKIYGIDDRVREICLEEDGRRWKTTLHPNEELVPERGVLKVAMLIPFDYPFHPDRG